MAEFSCPACGGRLFGKPKQCFRCGAAVERPRSVQLPEKRPRIDRSDLSDRGRHWLEALIALPRTPLEKVRFFQDGLEAEADPGRLATEIAAREEESEVWISDGAIEVSRHDQGLARTCCVYRIGDKLWLETWHLEYDD